MRRQKNVLIREKKNIVDSFISSLGIDDNIIKRIQLVHFQNFCYTEVSETERIHWIKKYLSNKNHHLSISKNPNVSLIQLGCLCYLRDKGYLIEGIEDKEIISKIMNYKLSPVDSNNEFIKKIPEKNKTELTDSNKEYLNNEVISISNEIDMLIDKFTIDKTTKLDIPEAFKRLNSKILKKITQLPEYNRLKNELTIALNNQYSDLHEAYSNFTKPQLKKLLDFISVIINYEPPASEKIGRKKKLKKSNNSFEKFSPLESWNGFTGIQGKEILESKALLICDITGKIGLIFPGEEGFKIYRKAIKNIDNNQSIYKHFQTEKLIEILKEFNLKNLPFVKNKLTQIKRVNKVFSGMCSKNIIIIKGFH